MDSLKQKFSEFMRGRNGSDELTVCTLVLALVLLVINLFAGALWLTIVVLALIAYAVFRMLSPDVSARRDENAHFLTALGPARPWVINPAAAMRESRSYKHLQCPHCGQTVRVPRGKGAIRVTCPKCHEKFEARS